MLRHGPRPANAKRGWGDRKSAALLGPGAALERGRARSPPMTVHDPLLQPLRLKGLTLKNRVMSTAHAPAYVKDGLPQERYQLYHEEKAKGGLALTMFGGSSTVAPESPSAFGQIDISDDRIVPVLQGFAERI